MSATVCTCGCTEAHKIMTRKTADGRTIHLWTDGDITTAFGFRIRGIGKALNAWSADADMIAARALFAHVELLDFNEVERAFNALRKAVRAPYLSDCSWRWPSGGPTTSQSRRIVMDALSA